MATIGTNLAAISASNYLTINNEALTKSIKRLSSGSRLADPSDDAAGVAVSGNLDARISRLQAAAEGSQDIVSLAQTADGFLSTIQSQLTRMSELAQRATNGAFGSTDRQNYQTEFSKIASQIDSIASNATFNGTSLFAGTTITIAINSDGITDSIALDSVGSLATLGGISSAATGTGTIDTTTDAIATLSLLNTAIASITTRRAVVNADISKFNFYISNIRTETVNVQAANSRIKDLDVADESTNLSKQNILLQAATSMLAQANTSQQTVLQLLR